MRRSLGVVATVLLVLAGQCEPKDPPRPGHVPRPPVPRTTIVTSSTSPSMVAVPPAATVPPATTFTTTSSTMVVGLWSHPNPRVERWHQAALAAGWPESSWPRLSCIIARESGGDPSAYNGADPGLGSYGLLQLNLSLGEQGTWVLWGPGLGWDAARLYDPATNLSYGRALFERAQRMWGAGWRPWGPGSC